MAKSNRILLVEGEADCCFFESLCKQLALDAHVTVAPPKQLGGTHNTKQGVFNYLPTLLKQLGDNEEARLAIVVDADQIADGNGCEKAVERIAKELAMFGFTTAPAGGLQQGLLFKHDDGLADFGLWVMPNNHDEGSLEHWISDCRHSNEHALFTHAKSTVAALTNPKFKQIRTIKAEVATWLAWQDKPGEGLYYTIDGGLLDENAPLYTGLCSWLKKVFS